MLGTQSPLHPTREVFRGISAKVRKPPPPLLTDRSPVSGDGLFSTGRHEAFRRAVAALFALACLASALPASAQTQTEIWSATLTAGARGSYTTGYCAIPFFTGGAGDGGCNYGSLSDDDFTLDGTTYAVRSIREGNDYTHLTLDKKFPTARLSGLTLRIGSVDCALSDADVETVDAGTVPNNYRWTNTEDGVGMGDCEISLVNDSTTTVKILLPNNAPVFANASLTRSVAENTAANTNVGAAIPAATDADGDTLTYSMEGTDASSFNFNASTRQIQTKSGITYNFETKSSYSVTIKVSDGTASDTVAVTINLTDVNEPPSAPAAPVVSATSGSTTSLDVNWGPPANTGPAITSYDLQYRAGSSGGFTAGPQNVTGTSASIPNLVAGTSYQVQVRATNAEGDSNWSSAGTGSTNTPGNSAPNFTATSLTRSVAENTAANTNVGAAIPAATDADGDTLTYSMEGTDASSFNFNASTRQIQTKSGTTYDFETKSSYSVAIKVSDGIASDTVAVTISLTDVDEPPATPAAPSVSATPGSTTSLDVNWSPPANTGPAITSYDLRYRAGTSGSFTNGPQDVAGTSAAIPNLTAGTAYQVQVRATNAEGDSNWSPAGTGNTNTPGNNAPMFTVDTLTFSLAEGAAANTNVGTAIPAATDADGDPLTYSMEGADADSFSFDPSTRQIRTRAGVTYDFETKPSYTVIINASDGAVSDVVTVTINLTTTSSGGDMPTDMRNVEKGSGVQSRQREAWLARLGRTTAGHVAEAVGERLSATSATKAKLDLGGAATESALLTGTLQALAGETAADGRRMLADSSFVLPLASGGAHKWTAWGRGAYTEFDGEEGGLDLDGEVWTGIVGMDWERGRWRLGLALSHGEGDGEVRAEEGGHHDLESKLTSVHPYARWQMRDGLSAWGLLGYGEGELESRKDGATSETDTEMRMAAFGLRGSLGTYESARGSFDLVLKSDVLAVRTEADAGAGLPEVEADVQRVRVLLEGAGRHGLESGGTLWPTLEAGLRYDEGDAETGLGAEVGAGLRFADASGRMSAELSARGLLAHEENEYDEWGVSGSLVLGPDAAGRGLSLRLGSSFGATGRKTDELWNRHDLAGPASEESMASAGRFEAELGYGGNGPDGHGTLTSYAGLERDDSTTQWRLGTRLEVREEFQIRLEGASGDEHSLEMQGFLRW